MQKQKMWTLVDVNGVECGPFHEKQLSYIRQASEEERAFFMYILHIKNLPKSEINTESEINIKKELLLRCEVDVREEARKDGFKC